MKTALVTGTFDPVTKGHMDVITRTADLFDHEIVAVMNNLKKGSLFPQDLRRQMAEAACRDLPNVTVVADAGMMVDFFDRSGADVIVRGIRNETDFAYESYMADYLREHNPRIDTLFLHADPSLAAVSSTEVRERLARGEDVSDEVPAGILPYFRNLH